MSSSGTVSEVAAADLIRRQILNRTEWDKSLKTQNYSRMTASFSTPSQTSNRLKLIHQRLCSTSGCHLKSSSKITCSQFYDSSTTIHFQAFSKFQRSPKTTSHYKIYQPQSSQVPSLGQTNLSTYSLKSSWNAKIVYHSCMKVLPKSLMNREPNSSKTVNLW